MTGPRAALVLTASAIALRVAFVVWTAATPGFVWIDPDGYLDQALLFDTGRVVDAFRYFDFFKAPAYPVFLALCRHLPGEWPLNAAIVQAVLSGGMTWPLYSMARRVGSARVAVVVAAAYVIYVPGVMALMTMMQERVYLPLLALALASLVRAADRPSMAQAAGAGAALGVAALARSMPIYFSVVAMLWFLRTPSVSSRARWGLAGGFLAAFLVVVLPYSLWLSPHAGRLVLVEDIGSYGFARLSPEGRAYFGDDMPTVGSTAAFLGRKFAAAPGPYVRDIAGITGGMFQVPGGSWLEEHGHARSPLQARLMKVHAVIGGDLLFAVVAILAAAGFAYGHHRRAVAIVGLWVGTHLFLTAVSGYGGQRFRQPIDVSLFVLAAAALSPPWQRGWWRSVVLVVLVAPVAVGVSSSWRPSIAARSDYGVIGWRSIDTGREAALRLPAGFNSTQPGQRLELTLSATESTAARVLVNGFEVATPTVGPRPATVSVPHRGGRVFVEILATDDAGRAVTVTMPGYR